MPKKYAEGDRAANFTLPRDGGGTVSLADFADRPLVLYFYPKDDTPGCTREAIGFSQLADRFAAAGAAIVGVSKDSVARHDKFRDKHDLKIVLASDEDRHTIEAYGVWIEKKLYGRTYMGIERATFLIDGTGTIRRIWHKVKVNGHAEEVLAAVEAL